MNDDSALVRDAMDRTADQLPPLLDLVPGAVSQGRRRRARTRLAVAAGVFGVATVTTLGAVALPGGDGGARGSGVGSDGTVTSAPTAPTDAATPEPYRTPVHVEPTSGETPEGSLEGLSPTERTRFEDFQQRAAVALDEALPEAVGRILPQDSTILGYQGERDGKVFHVHFSVRPDDGETAGKCFDDPAKGMTCTEAELPGGIEAKVRVAPTGSLETTGTSITFTYGGSDVRLDVAPDEAAGASAPVTAEQLADGVRESGLLDVVKYADEHPLLEKQVSIVGG